MKDLRDWAALLIASSKCQQVMEVENAESAPVLTSPILTSKRIRGLSQLQNFFVFDSGRTMPEIDFDCIIALGSDQLTELDLVSLISPSVRLVVIGGEKAFEPIEMARGLNKDFVVWDGHHVKCALQHFEHTAWAFRRADEYVDAMKTPRIDETFWSKWVPRARALAEFEVCCAQEVHSDIPAVKRMSMTLDSEKLAEAVQYIFKSFGRLGWPESQALSAWGQYKTIQLVGHEGKTHPDTPGFPYHVTGAWIRAGEVIQQFLGPIRPALQRVRLTTLEPDSNIRWHDERDTNASVRIYVPVFAEADVDIRIAGGAVRMSPGEVWISTLHLPMHVVNNGKSPSTMLVVDVGDNDMILRTSSLGEEVLVLQEEILKHPMHQAAKEKLQRALDKYLANFEGNIEAQQLLEYEYYCRNGSHAKYFASSS
eukprot:gnl/MRDRNA2_/MRDRNA2_52063_c0_seq1.p1 gnl/MRDRNA2_/MRDRNA2_52063_c0~~gnl/MRDRNA2_/MRDRNA2_52063_c0_seq1.p1  ORF type:complete len:439 (-),score=79.20 gnl/MRDRNA2_/MRDRNA2_52063_c0_seq1:159-1433(-)